MCEDTWLESDYEALRRANKRHENEPDLDFEECLNQAYHGLYLENNPDDGYRYFGN